MATVHAYAKARGYPTYPRATLGEVLRAAAVAIPALMTPVIIVGGKIFGWFTATESACIAVLYAAALSILVYREMNLKGLHEALLDNGKLAGIALSASAPLPPSGGCSRTTRSRRRSSPVCRRGTWA